MSNYTFGVPSRGFPQAYHPLLHTRNQTCHEGARRSAAATSSAAVCVVVHLRRGRAEVQLQRSDQRSCLASMQRRACSSVGRDGRLQRCARLPQRRRLHAALEHRPRAKMGELHHQLPQGSVRADTATATAATDGAASRPAAHVVRGVPHGTHGAERVAACEQPHQPVWARPWRLRLVRGKACGTERVLPRHL